MRLLITMTIASAVGCGFQVQPSTSDAASDADAMAPDSPPDGPPDGPPGDVDGDGIADAVDNCPQQHNLQQWNEDLDAFGDDCDPCPQVAAAQLDADGDGIGDDCDPRPAQAGDVLARFDGFNVPAAGPPAGWTVQTFGTGSWAVAGGALTYTTINDSESVLQAAIPGGLGSEHAVDATATVTQAVASIQVAAVITDVDPLAMPRFFHCAVRMDSGGEVELYWLAANAWTRIDSVERPSVTQQTPYRLRARVATGYQDCNAAGIALTGGLARFNGTRVGLRAKNVSATFPYFAVYRTP